MPLRLLVDDGASAAGGLALDEALASRVGAGRSAPTLRLYTYRPHCALVGRFQDASREVDLDVCEREDIEVNRRPTGGGAILMGPDQLGVALALPRESGGPRALMTGFSNKIARALAKLGVDAAFRGKNDLAVNGRKIAGLGVHRDSSGGLLFHASVLLDLDVSLMVRVLRTPFAKVSDREVRMVSRRIATIRGLVNREVTIAELRDHLASAFGVKDAGELDPEERQAVANLEESRYGDPGWLRQRTPVTDTAGRASLRTSGGLVDVHVAMAGRTVKAAWIRGDFVADEGAVADLEGRLRWHSSDQGAITATVQDAWRHESGTVDADALIQTISSAIIQARDESAAPYGCFVTPEASHG